MNPPPLPVCLYYVSMLEVHVNNCFQMEQKDDTTVQDVATREEVAEKSEEQHEEEEVKEEELEVEKGRREPEEEEEERSDNEARGGGGTSCNICGELVTGGHEFIRHLADVHWKNIWCYDCSMGFNFESEFKRHLM